MFSPALRTASDVFRWSIVRTHRRQSIAEHSFHVVTFVNAIAVCLELPVDQHLEVMQVATYHDATDEIFTGDIPGPAKRGMADRQMLNASVDRWQDHTFPAGWRTTYAGNSVEGDTRRNENKAILKIADGLEELAFLVEEIRMGNTYVSVIAHESLERLNGYIDDLGFLKYGETKQEQTEVPFGYVDDAKNAPIQRLRHAIDKYVHELRTANPAGPEVFGRV